jgi:hypothetical protein
MPTHDNSAEWKKLLRLVAVVAAAVAALTVLFAVGAAFGGTGAVHARKYQVSFLARWPGTQGAQRTYLKQYRVSSAGVPRVRVFVGDAEVGKPPGDYIVACAHRGPSFASQTTLVAGDVLYLLLVLETGSCSPGPSVAGAAVPVTVFITG